MRAIFRVGECRNLRTRSSGTNAKIWLRYGLLFTKGRNEVGRVTCTFKRRVIYSWLKEKEYMEYLLRNEDDKYGGKTPPVGPEAMRREFDIWQD